MTDAAAPARGWGATCITAALRFDQRDGWALSSHVALSLMLAIFPFCLSVLSLAGEINADVPQEDLIQLILGAWPDEVADPIEREIRAVLAGGGYRSFTISMLLSLYFSSNGVDAVRLAFARAYRGADPRPFWRTRLLSMLFVLLGALLVAAVAALLIALPLFLTYWGGAAPGVMVTFLADEAVRWTLTMGLLGFAVVACHAWLPGTRPSLRAIMPGVALTLGLWVLVAQGFSYYLRHFVSYSVTYAGLAGVMAALVFMYLMSAILIFGAEINGARAGAPS